MKIRILKARKSFLCLLLAAFVTLSFLFTQQLCRAFSPASAAGTGSELALPVLLYHSLEQNAAYQYAITPAQFEQDLKYLTEHNYTTVGVQELIDYVYESKPLPENPVVITFDDGLYNNYAFSLPLLKQYNHKIILSVIGKDTDIWSKDNYADLKHGHISWDQINEMLISGHVEFASHTYDLHQTTKGRKGSKKKAGESTAHYQDILRKDLVKLQNKFAEMTGTHLKAFTFPLEEVSPEAFDILQELDIPVAFTVTGPANIIRPGDPDCLRNLKRKNRIRNTSAEKLLKQS